MAIPQQLLMDLEQGAPEAVHRLTEAKTLQLRRELEQTKEQCHGLARRLAEALQRLQSMPVPVGDADMPPSDANRPRQRWWGWP